MTLCYGMGLDMCVGHGFDSKHVHHIDLDHLTPSDWTLKMSNGLNLFYFHYYMRWRPGAWPFSLR